MKFVIPFPDHLAGRSSNRSQRSRIGHHDLALDILHEHQIGRGLGDRSENGFAASQRIFRLLALGNVMPVDVGVAFRGKWRDRN